jgi:signal peptidase I
MKVQKGRRGRRLVVALVLVGIAITVVGAMVVVGAVRQGARVLYVPSAAMEPTYPQGSRLLVVRPPDDGPRAGDVVIHPLADDPSRPVLKRVIAVGPATVAFAGGSVVVDGRPLDEPYLAPRATTRPAPAGLGPQCTTDQPCTIGEGQLWVMGDNRENSEDSRFYGPVRRDAVTGVVARRLSG